MHRLLHTGRFAVTFLTTPTPARWFDGRLPRYAAVLWDSRWEYRSRRGLARRDCSLPAGLHPRVLRAPIRTRRRRPHRRQRSTTTARTRWGPTSRRAYTARRDLSATAPAIGSGWATPTAR